MRLEMIELYAQRLGSSVSHILVKSEESAFQSVR